MNNPIKRLNPDKSRSKSLYFLLQAVARTLSLSKTDRETLKSGMATLSINENHENWIISTELQKKSLSIPKSNFKFYKHSDSSEIADQNKAEASKVILSLFPTLELNRLVNTKFAKAKDELMSYFLKYSILILYAAASFLAKDINILLFESFTLSFIVIVFLRIENLKYILAVIINSTVYTFVIKPDINLSFNWLIFSIILLYLLKSYKSLKKKSEITYDFLCSSLLFITMNDAYNEQNLYIIFAAIFFTLIVFYLYSKFAFLKVNSLYTFIIFNIAVYLISFYNKNILMQSISIIWASLFFVYLLFRCGSVGYLPKIIVITSMLLN